MRTGLLVAALCALALAAGAEGTWVKVACTQGPDTLEKYGLPAFEKALDYAGERGAGLVLLPEYANGEMVPEPLEGPTARLMSDRARRYSMYVAGTIGRKDAPATPMRNTALLFGRDGKLMGTYDKIHLYGDELTTGVMEAGTTVPVFETDFGRVGFVTCSDVGYADVASSVTAQGARLVLFPNLGYNPAVVKARAEENGVWMVASSRSGAHNAWDGAGRDIMSTATRGQMRCRDLETTVLDGLGVLMVMIEVDDGHAGVR